VKDPAAAARDADPDHEKVVLVDEADHEIGIDHKERAHRQGRLHRAFSVFVFDRLGRLLLQQRARDKYHSGGLWSNTCCSHPRPGEAVMAAAHRRLREEMGFDCPLRWSFAFIYEAPVGGGLVEHEYDHVCVGSFDGEPACDSREVAAWRWETVDVVRQDIAVRPDAYAVWFRIALEQPAATSPWPQNTQSNGLAG
jgi:isopentenyl-diphosphate delta-isomerase